MHECITIIQKYVHSPLFSFIVRCLWTRFTWFEMKTGLRNDLQVMQMVAPRYNDDNVNDTWFDTYSRKRTTYAEMNTAEYTVYDADIEKSLYKIDETDRLTWNMVTIRNSPSKVLNKLCHVWTMNKLCVSLKRTAVLHNNFQCNQMHVQTMLTCFKICWLKAQCLFVFIILLCNMKLCYNNTPLLENSVK